MASGTTREQLPAPHIQAPVGPPVASDMSQLILSLRARFSSASHQIARAVPRSSTGPGSRSTNALVGSEYIVHAVRPHPAGSPPSSHAARGIAVFDKKTHYRSFIFLSQSAKTSRSAAKEISGVHVAVQTSETVASRGPSSNEAKQARLEPGAYKPRPTGRSNVTCSRRENITPSSRFCQ